MTVSPGPTPLAYGEPHAVRNQRTPLRAQMMLPGY
jgi:hypothetical protein